MPLTQASKSTLEKCSLHVRHSVRWFPIRSRSFSQLGHFHPDASGNELLIYKPYFGPQCVYKFELLVRAFNGSAVNQLDIQPNQASCERQNTLTKDTQRYVRFGRVKLKSLLYYASGFKSKTDILLHTGCLQILPV